MALGRLHHLHVSISTTKSATAVRRKLPLTHRILQAPAGVTVMVPIGKRLCHVRSGHLWVGALSTAIVQRLGHLSEGSSLILLLNQTLLRPGVNQSR